MKLLKEILPNVSLAFSIALGVVTYVDNRNPQMGFLRGTPAQILIYLTVAFSVATALVLYISWRREKANSDTTEK